MAEEPSHAPQTNPAAPQPAASSDDVEKNKIMGVIAYIGLLFLVPLLAAKESRFAMYHANQGLNLFLLNVALGVVWIIPILGWIVGAVGWIFTIVLMVMGIVNA